MLDRGRVVARTADGQPLRMVAYRYRAAEAARIAAKEQQLHLSEAQRIASMGSWSFDPNSGHFWWSPELRSLLALEQGAVPGQRRWLKQLHPRSRGALRAAWRRLWRDGRASSWS